MCFVGNVGATPISKEQKQIAHFFNEYSLNHTRILDLIKLCELRNYDMDGCREYVLFLYRYWSCCITQDPEEALERAKELNNEFLNPLKTREVIYSTKSAEKAYLDKEKQYKYKNETLIELLKITHEEQKSLKNIIGKEEKYSRNNQRRCKKRRNENGLTQRQQEKINLQMQIIELLQQDKKAKEIAEKLGVTKRTIERNIKDFLQNKNATRNGSLY